MGKGKTVLLVVIALVVLGLLIYLGSEQPTMSPTDTPENGDQPTEQVDNNDQATDPGTDATQDVSEEEEDTSNQLPPAVFNTTGEITTIGSNYITIQSDGSHMEDGESVEVTVNITDSTNLLDSSNNEISLSGFSQGDNVSVEASGNIKNQTEIEGSNVKISE